MKNDWQLTNTISITFTEKIKVDFCIHLEYKVDFQNQTCLNLITYKKEIYPYILLQQKKKPYH
jgi:hypothetical protein